MSIYVTHVKEICQSLTPMGQIQPIGLLRTPHTYEWNISNMWMSHVTHTSESCHTYEWVKSCIWRSHVTHMDESCDTYKSVMSYIWISHVTRTNLSCMWMSQVTHMNESCHSYERVMLHIRQMSHVTHVNESYHTCKWVMSMTYPHWTDPADGLPSAARHWDAKPRWASRTMFYQPRTKGCYHTITPREWVVSHKWVSYDTWRTHSLGHTMFYQPRTRGLFCKRAL